MLPRSLCRPESRILVPGCRQPDFKADFGIDAALTRQYSGRVPPAGIRLAEVMRGIGGHEFRETRAVLASAPVRKHRRYRQMRLVFVIVIIMCVPFQSLSDWEAATTTARENISGRGCIMPVRITLRLLRLWKLRVSCGPGVAAIRLLSTASRRWSMPSCASSHGAIWCTSARVTLCKPRHWCMRLTCA